MTPELVLILGGIGAALLGLVGIRLTQHDNTPILGLLNEGELKSYRIQRLMTEGIAWCGLGQHEFRPGPGASTTACPECLPPVPVPNAVGKWEPHYQPEHRTRALNFGKSYRPLYMDYPDLFKEGGPDEA